jgi:hypothetical protein
MLAMDVIATRFISTTLTEAEWKTLKMVQPDPARWLREQVKLALAQASVVPSAPERPEVAN